MEQGDRGGGSKYHEKEKTERESETPVLGELNPPKNPKTPWRNQKIANGGLESFPSGVIESCERMRVKE
jgi:hypothetical protein